MTQFICEVLAASLPVSHAGQLSVNCIRGFERQFLGSQRRREEKWFSSKNSPGNLKKISTMPVKETATQKIPELYVESV